MHRYENRKEYKILLNIWIHFSTHVLATINHWKSWKFAVDSKFQITLNYRHLANLLSKNKSQANRTETKRRNS